ncbi:CLOCK-interacting pacemaker a isoform X1 [Triplophysa dalaica]|uniref:CLOCK-interacting pacemaker a isoform X1 n=1 Tax=Triplophysa dalaica TaxID=1582913 RepID=UPI0024E03BE6|nr:CLOCK-interacting pacemaker a isoform X1 [Triplophysa dalaica]
MGNKRKAPSDIDKYSDASSGYFSALDQTDFEDVVPTTTATHSMQTARQVPFIPGSHTGVSPMIIMNNLVLKQPKGKTPASKPWSLNPSGDVVPQSQLVFLQPVMPTGDCTSRSSGKPKHSKKYVSTYTKIAPHPAPVSPDFGPSTINKKSNHSGRHQHRHHDDDKPLYCLNQNEAFKDYDVHPNDASCEFSHRPSADLAVEDSLSRLSDHQEPHTTTSPNSHCSDSVLSAYPQKCFKAEQNSDVENIQDALSPSMSKRKRFCNTYEILNRSGLLGITLRTKELIRQNKRSQAQLQSLQAQTDLFLEAICSGDPKVWTRLQLTLQNSGDYEDNAVETGRSV